MQKIFTVLPAKGSSPATHRTSTLIWRLMKMTMVQLMLAIVSTALAIANDSKAQGVLDRELSLHLNNVTIGTALSEIEVITNVKFVYSRNHLKLEEKISIHAEKLTLAQVLNTILQSQDVNYKLQDNNSHIVLTPNQKQKKNKRDQSLNVESTFTENLPLIIVSGIVKDNNGMSLPGVNVIVKGSTIGTATGADGGYKLEVQDDNSILVFSFIGYATQEIPVNGRTIIDVTLQTDVATLSEVVVVGYGEVKKSDLTGSVASVTEKDFNKSPTATNVDLLIQGKAPGVNIMQTNPQPGGATSIQIRGTTSVNASNEPLYVIDGLPIDNRVLNAPNTNLTANSVFSPPPANPLNTISPSDIASIEILKDASATAIYGSRGANGVILITTKRGQTGAPTVAYNASLGFQKIARNYDVLDATEYANLYNQYYDFYQTQRPTDPIFNNSAVKKFTAEEIAALEGNGTDWFNLLTRTGVVTNHQVSVNGGSNTTTYYASIGYTNQKGVVQNSDFRRINSRINLNQKLGSIAEFGVNLSIANSNTGNMPIGTADAGDTRAGAMSGALTWSPTAGPYNDDGTIARHPFSAQTSNPAALLLGDFESENNRTLINTYLKVNITEDFSAKLSGGYDKSLDNTITFVPAEAKNSLAANGEATKGSYMNTSQLLNFLLTYKKTFGASTFDVTAGTDYQTFDFESLYAKAYGFTTSAFRDNNMSAATNQLTFSGKSKSAIFSYLGRINYGLNDKYLVTASFRYDGSSKFAEGQKWGFFPSAAVAWKIGQEQFLSDLDVFSTLKIRASWGRTGNQGIGTNNSQPLLGALQFATIGDVKITPIGPVSPGNADLTWETTSQTDIGLDFGILDNRITGSIDYYNAVTNDLLLNFQLPRTSGFNSVVRNAGSIQNRGIEIGITSENLSEGALTWTTNFNLAYNKNNWKDRAGIPYGIEDEHGPLGGIYGYEVEGIFQTGDDIANSAQPLSVSGHYKFRDLRGRDAQNLLINVPDTAINADDRVFLGNSRPTTTLGFTNTFTYKNITLSLFFQGMFDFEIYNATRASLENPYNLFYLRGVGTDARDFWRPDNASNKVQSGVPNPYGSLVNSVYVEKGDFVRLRNIYLGYNIPFEGRRISRANVYLSVDNALLITKYKGLDPESASPINTKSGSENDVYPNPRTYSIGLNVTF